MHDNWFKQRPLTGTSRALTTTISHKDSKPENQLKSSIKSAANYTTSENARVNQRVQTKKKVNIKTEGLLEVAKKTSGLSTSILQDKYRRDSIYIAQPFVTTPVKLKKTPSKLSE